MEADGSNILAPGLRPDCLSDSPFPAFTDRRGDRLACGNRIQLQQRNCSGFTPDFSRRSTVSNSQRTKRAIAACASAFKIYLVRARFRAHFSSASD
jgi:hypothetical protein